MVEYMKAGWTTTRNHFFIIILLYIYQLIWGFFLYEFVNSVVFPLLKRYPVKDLPEAVKLFYIEGQFQIMKTDLTHTYLWILLAFFLVRMMITPFIQAGLYYSVHYSPPHKSVDFFAGMKRMAKPFCMYYLCQMALTFAPLYWIVPASIKAFAANSTYTSVAAELAPPIAAWLAYGATVHLLFMYIQFGKITERSLWRSLKVWIRYLFPIVGLALMLAVLSAVIALIGAAVSMIWAGLLALILHQVYHLIRVWFKIWDISTQYHYWMAKSG